MQGDNRRKQERATLRNLKERSGASHAASWPHMRRFPEKPKSRPKDSETDVNRFTEAHKQGQEIAVKVPKEIGGLSRIVMAAHEARPGKTQIEAKGFGNTSMDSQRRTNRAMKSL